MSALLNKHLKGNPETSLQYFCFHKVVMEDRKPHKHHYAPIFMNSVRSHAGQGGPSSTSPPDLVTIHQQLMGANMTSLHSSVLPPNPKSPTPQSKLFPLPSRQSPHPPEHLVHLLQQEIFRRGTELREGKSKTGQLGFLSKTLFHQVRPDEFNVSTDWEQHRRYKKGNSHQGPLRECQLQTTPPAWPETPGLGKRDNDLINTGGKEICNQQETRC